MNWEKVDRWKDKERINELKNLIENDDSYWKKLSLIITMEKIKNKSKFLEMITNHKLEEQKMFEEEFGISLKRVFSFEDIKIDTKDRDYSEIMKKLVDTSDNYDYNYAKASKQVLKIINHMEDGFYQKISKNFIEKLHKNAQKIKKSDIEEVSDFNELNLLEETKDILALIYHKFWKNM